MRKIGIISGIFLINILTAQALTLNDCVALALDNKETIESAQFGLQSAKAGKIGSYSNILPSVSFSAGRSESKYANSDLYEGNITWSAGLNVSQNIFDGGGWWNQIADANNNYAIEQQVERQVKINVIAEVHRTYFQLLKYQQLVEVAKQSLALAEQQVELAQRKYDLGAAKKTDLLKSEVAAGLARSNLITQEAFYYTTKSELLNALGLFGDREDIAIIDEQDELKPLMEFDEAVDILENNNPEILTSKLNLKSSEISKKLTNAVRLPSLSASLFYQGSDSKLNGLSSALKDDWTMTTGLNLSFPLFTGLSYSTQSQRAKLAVKNQENAVAITLDDAIVSLENYYETVSDYFKIIPIYEEILVSAEEDFKLATEQYRLGSISILELLDAQVSVTQARVDLVGAKYDAKIQESYLKAQLGILDKEFENN